MFDESHRKSCKWEDGLLYHEKRKMRIHLDNDLQKSCILHSAKKMLDFETGFPKYYIIFPYFVIIQQVSFLQIQKE